MRYFTAVASKTLKLNSKYHVSVSAHGYDEPQSLSIAVKRDGEEIPAESCQKIVKLSGDESQIVEYDLKDQVVGDYILEAKTIDGEKFERKFNLNLNLKKFSLFVQTDKSIYKPSEKIQFRVLLLDIDTRPFESSNVLIYVNDGAQNRVKQFVNPKFTKGVFQNELQLSDSPVMGSWTIHVKVDDAEEEVTYFEVAEYVLPKFEVIVESNPNVSFKDGVIKATVYGKYTYGKLAKGKAKVTAKVSNDFGGFGCWRPMQPDNVKVSKTIEIDGKKDVEFTFADELELKEIHYNATVVIEAFFTEELSGREHKGSTKVTIHKKEFEIELQKSAEKIKPGLPYSVTAFVKKFNGAPVIEDILTPVEFNITTYWEIKDRPLEVPEGCEPAGDQKIFRRWEENEESDSRIEKVFIKNSSAILSIEIPQHATQLTVEAKYHDSTQQTWQIQKEASECNHFVQVKLTTEK